MDLVAKYGNTVLVFEYKTNETKCNRKKALDVQLKDAYFHYSSLGYRVRLFYATKDKIEYVPNSYYDKFQKHITIRR